MSNKYCHAELVSASTLYTVHRFRNEFGMTLRNELFGQPLWLLFFTVLSLNSFNSFDCAFFVSECCQAQEAFTAFTKA